MHLGSRGVLFTSSVEQIMSYIFWYFVVIALVALSVAAVAKFFYDTSHLEYSKFSLCIVNTLKSVMFCSDSTRQMDHCIADVAVT